MLHFFRHCDGVKSLCGIGIILTALITNIAVCRRKWQFEFLSPDAVGLIPVDA